MNKEEPISKYKELVAASLKDPLELERMFNVFVNNAIRLHPREYMVLYNGLIQSVEIWEQHNPMYRGFYLLAKAFMGYYEADYTDAVSACEEAIDIFSKYGQMELCGIAHMIAGGNQRSFGNIDHAVNYLYKSLELIRSDGKYGLFLTYANYQLAEIFSFIQDFDSAKEAYHNAIKYAEQNQNSSGLFRSNNGLGNLYVMTGDLKKGLYYLKKSMNQPDISSAQRARVYCDLGQYYYKTGEYALAEEILKKSYSIRVEGKLSDASSTSLIHLAMVHLETDRTDLAVQELEQALEITIENKSKSKQLECYHLLGKAYRKKEEWEKSVLAYTMYDTIQSEFSSVTLKNVYKIKNKKIEEQKQVIETALEDIHSSINYAQRIQKAILPPKDLIHKYLPESFIFYRPKDIVAGDFYWFELVGEMVLFAVADCTGHGVPGAMVSVVCHNALNRAVREYKLTSPAAILDQVNLLVQDSLSNSEDTEVKDGMDIALCAFDPYHRQITFAGANNPLYIISDKNNLNLNHFSSNKSVINDTLEIYEIKGDKQPIGKFSKSKPFDETLIQLTPGDEIILSSDGYPDQFGGKNKKKLMYRPFKTLLLETYDNNPQQTCTLLEKYFLQWKGTEEQTDDVCVIGIRF